MQRECIAEVIFLQIAFSELVSAIPERYSVRQYSGNPIPEDVQAALMNTEELAHLPSIMCRAVWVYAPGELDNIFTGIIGSYGKIRGASGIIALLVPEDSGKMGLLQAGYVGEQYVLRATTLGLATCWVGGTFKFKPLMGRFTIAPGEKLVGIIAVGYAPKDKPKSTFFLHRVIKRKAIEQIATPELLNGGTWIREALEAVRLAPSAINMQPWQFSGGQDAIILSPSKRGPFAYVDLGIAMLHFELAALRAGRDGKWTIGESITFNRKEQ